MEGEETDERVYVLCGRGGARWRCGVEVQGTFKMHVKCNMLPTQVKPVAANNCCKQHD